MKDREIRMVRSKLTWLDSLFCIFVLFFASISAAAGVSNPIKEGGPRSKKLDPSPPSDPSQVCRILTLSGGGSWGAYETGVVSGLVGKRGEKGWDVYAGVSAGSLIAAYLSANEPGSDIKDKVEEMYELWTRRYSAHGDFYKINPKIIYDPLHAQSFFNVKSFSDNLRSLFQKRKLPQAGLVIGATSLKAGVIKTMSKWDTSEQVVKWVQASCSIPGLFPPVQVEEDLLVDGAVVHNEFILDALKLCPPGKTRIHLDIISITPTMYPLSDADYKNYNYIEIVARSFQIATLSSDLEFIKYSASYADSYNIYQPKRLLQNNPLDFSQNLQNFELGYRTVQWKRD